jgi:hypothetical protein
LGIGGDFRFAGHLTDTKGAGPIRAMDRSNSFPLDEQ